MLNVHIFKMRLSTLSYLLFFATLVAVWPLGCVAQHSDASAKGDFGDEQWATDRYLVDGCLGEYARFVRHQLRSTANRDYSAPTGIAQSILVWGLIWNVLVGVREVYFVGTLPDEGIEEPLVSHFDHIAFVDSNGASTSSGIAKCAAYGKCVYYATPDGINDVPISVADRLAAAMAARRAPREAQGLPHKPVLVWLGWEDKPAALRLHALHRAILPTLRTQDVLVTNVADLMTQTPAAEDTSHPLHEWFASQCAVHPGWESSELLMAPARSDLAAYRMFPMISLQRDISKVSIDELTSRIASVDPTPLVPPRTPVTNVPADITEKERMLLENDDAEFPRTPQMDSSDSTEQASAFTAEQQGIVESYRACMEANTTTGGDSTASDAVAVDLIVFTRNRPLETFAFIESLTDTIGAHLTTVWVQYRADSERIANAYELVRDCLAPHSSFRIELVRDLAGTFEQSFRSILSRASSHVILNVDEQIFLRSANVRSAACLMHADTRLQSTQLRLHPDLQRRYSNPVRQSRRLLTPLEGADSPVHRTPDESSLFWFAYVPFRLGIPWSYLSNIDAAMLSKERLLEHMSVCSPSNPMQLEQQWLFRNTHKWDSDFHLFPSATLVINNNNAIGGGRVMTSRGVTSGAQLNVDRFLDDRLVIDLTAFRARVTPQKVKNTHPTIEVDFRTRDNVCRL